MSTVHFKKEGKVGVLTLDHPPANALSSQVILDLSARFDEIEKDPEVKAVVIHGEGRFFSAGADIKEFTEVKDGTAFAELSKRGQDLFSRIESFYKPVIAAIHGAALGGGLELAMGCHMRLVEKGSKLGLPELQLGLIPGFAGTQRLPRLVGLPKATEMMLTSDPISAEEAVQYGLANRLAEAGKVYDDALEFAGKIAEKSAVSVKHLLACLHDARNGHFEQGMERERQSFGEVFTSYDGQEGIRAFIEKRKPQFLDK
ncbi:MAG: enoyl-CoA hydratase [Tuberibacillus sp.]